MIADLQPYPAMKDSGVPWLGEVPEQWQAKRLAQIGRFSKGNGGTKEDEVTAGVPCVRYGDLYTTHTYFIRTSRSCVAPERAEDYTPIEYGDVLFAASGETIDEIGKSAVSLIRSEACCGGDVILFRPVVEVEARFMGYATDCRPAAAQKASMARGTTVKHIYGDQLKYLSIAIPPLPEQAAIVGFLDHADRRIRRYIRAKQKLIKLLEEYKQAIIHRAVTRGLDPNVRLKPSGVEWLGDVPEHWEMSRVKNLARPGYKTFVDGDWIESPYITGAGVRLIQTGNIGVGTFREKGFRYISEDTFTAFGCTDFQPSDVLICRLGEPVGRACLAPELGVRMITSVDVCILKPREDVLPAFVVNAMSSFGYLEWVNSLVRGSTRDRVSRSMLGSFVVPLPLLPEQDAIVRFIDDATARAVAAIERAQREISLLREFRTRLIADVVTGKLDVREAAARLPDEADETEPVDETEAMTDAEEGMADDLDAAPEAVEA